MLSGCTQDVRTYQKIEALEDVKLNQPLDWMYIKRSKDVNIEDVWLGVLAAEVITAMDKAIVKYPGKSEIKFNYEFYRCKSCIQYLSGMTFTMEADGQNSDRLFAWNCGESPQLGIVNAQCKTMSQTYPYLS